jgi:hypothetical protein
MAEKRAASSGFGSAQLVKRQKSDANLNGKSIAVVNGSASSGALIQSVCHSVPNSLVVRRSAKVDTHEGERWLMVEWIGTSYEWLECPSHGIDR